MNIKELIEKLEQYPLDTEVCSGTLETDRNIMTHTDLIIKESHPIGDREAEEELLLWIGCKID